MIRYDTIVLGSGNAGMAAASTVRADGKSVAIVENRDVGGTCPIRGCVPKKVLVAAAEVLHQIASASEHHIRVGGVSLCWPSLIEREHGFVEGVAENFAQTLRARGIDLYRGSARFTDSDSITVSGKALKAEAIVIATGSAPRNLDIDGGEYCLTSEELLVDETLPESLIAIGGGVISLEFAHILARAGTRVTILEAAPEVLPRFDHDLVRILTKESERIGITIQTNARVSKIARKSGKYDVRFTVDNGIERSVTAEKVLNGTGRVADVTDLSLESAGIEHAGTQIMVDDHLRSVSNPRIYVAGDALHASPQLSPLASY